MKLSRKQVKEALQTVPIDQVLSVPGQLTAKQKRFALEVAQGATKADAYRRAYKADASKRTLAGEPYRVASDPRVSREIEAYKLANEAAKHRTPQQLRDLVIHSLVQVVIDPEANHAQRVQAAKVLGTVTEVAAFTERREVTHVKSAQDARAQLLERLRELMRQGATDIEARDVDALVHELGADARSGEGQEATPTPQNADWSPTQTMHTIPHTQFPSQSAPQSLPQSLTDTPPPDDLASESLEDELGNTPGRSGEVKG